MLQAIYVWNKMRERETETERQRKYDKVKKKKTVVAKKALLLSWCFFLALRI
jgi:hypothetical protein